LPAARRWAWVRWVEPEAERLCERVPVCVRARVVPALVERRVVPERLVPPCERAVPFCERAAEPCERALEPCAPVRPLVDCLLV
jgi:hypothetical protein